uniref:Methylmalonic aciduria and homocystinuria type D homolog, mitochondrial n=1 Tax=Panagrellus redivivus TaxID=6233 RepID=A0A7E4VGP4_PANRE
MSLPSSTRMGICRVNASAGLHSHHKALSTVARVIQSPAIFVENTSQRRTNNLLGPNKKFPFPGDVAIANTFAAPAVSAQTEAQTSEKVDKNDPLYRTVSVEQLLNSPLNIRKAADYAPEPVIDNLKSNCDVEMHATSCPRLLKKELKYLFVDMDLREKGVTVLNLSQKTETDQANWSPNMELERMKLTASFIDSANAVCQALKEAGYWADFIDPASGRPYLGKFTNASLFETDDRYRQLGFQIEDLGCCKVIKHMQWGTHAFVGTIFTDAPMESKAVQEIVKQVNLVAQ